jgi:hypothetical protein
MPKLGAQFKGSIPLHDLTSVLPQDIYEKLDKHVKSPGTKSMILHVRNKPTYRLRLHVLSPIGSSGVNGGDTGYIDRDYATKVGRENLPEGFKVLTKSVSARELFSKGDLHEWTWRP